VNPLHTKLTKVKDIPYFVDGTFLRTLYRDRFQLAQVERMVERAYENYLVDECNSQRRYKRGLLSEAQNKPTDDEIEFARRTAEKFELSRCVELNDLFPLRSTARAF
jgi:tRNA(Ile)-lysidine synthase TilS/MesJ